ncbi:MAG TPA: hypothetical protein VEX35_12565 [Allosphingosinicella sp.]|nr:hypothetical protein [Allosphingosinicella sp.]
MRGPERTIAIDLDVHRAIERARLGLGESQNDILRRLLLLGRKRRSGVAPGGDGGAPRRAGGPRGRGLWAVEIAGRRIPAANLKAAWRVLLRELAASQPRFLDELAAESGRGRRFVARSPAALYPRSPHLALRHAEPLIEGWFVDGNVSADQVARRARIAARLCGLHYGSDVRILDNLREL